MTLRLPDDLYEQLRAIAEKEDRSLTREIIRRLRSTMDEQLSPEPLLGVVRPYSELHDKLMEQQSSTETPNA